MTPLEQARIFVDQAKNRFENHPERRRAFAISRTQAALKIPVAEAARLVDQADPASTFRGRVNAAKG
jgi:hypothetical protein